MDERLLAGIRRFWTKEQIETAYQQVLTAYGNAAVKEVAITGNTFDGGGASGEVVLNRESMAGWMDVLEAALQEKQEEAGTGGVLFGGSPVVDFSTRIVGS